MVDFYLAQIAPRFHYVILVALLGGILSAILIGRVRGRLGPVERQRFILVESVVYGIFLVALVGCWIVGVTS